MFLANARQAQMLKATMFIINAGKRMASEFPAINKLDRQVYQRKRKVTLNRRELHYCA
jgi:hypothetical protein